MLTFFMTFPSYVPVYQTIQFLLRMIEVKQINKRWIRLSSMQFEDLSGYVFYNYEYLRSACLLVRREMGCSGTE